MIAQIRIALCFCLALLVSQGPAASQTACPGALVSARAEDTATVQRVCDVAARAGTRFAGLGLALSVPISVVITETLDAAPNHCVALFNTASNELQVLPEHCLEGRPGRLGYFPELPAAVFFDSLLVHELAHAFVEQTAAVQPSQLAHEYLAYALQLDALPADQRDRIVAAVDQKRPVVLADFNEALLSFAPQRYAAMAWLHFDEQQDQHVFVQRILHGKTTFQSLRE